MSAWLDELGRPSHHVMRFQAIAPMRAAATTAWVVVSLVDQPGADRLGDGRAGERADEVERGRHEQRVLRPERPGRDRRGDRVGGVVEPVDVVEHDRQQDDRRRAINVTFSMDRIPSGGANARGGPVRRRARISQPLTNRVACLVDLSGPSFRHAQWRAGYPTACTSTSARSGARLAASLLVPRRSSRGRAGASDPGLAGPRADRPVAVLVARRPTPADRLGEDPVAVRRAGPVRAAVEAVRGHLAPIEDAELLRRRSPARRSMTPLAGASPRSGRARCAPPTRSLARAVAGLTSRCAWFP